MLVPSSLGPATVALLLAVDLGQRFRRAKPTWVIAKGAEQTAAVVTECAGDATYWPTPWLGGLLGGHWQTISFGLNLSPPPIDDFTLEEWTTDDGSGTVALAWAKLPSLLQPSAPIVLILPGLCGSIKGSGHAVQAMISAGLRPVCWHARGCGQPLTSARFNLFGSTGDLREAIARIRARWPGAPVTLYSISAGTALMVRYLGEEADNAPVAAAVANSPGYDIGVCLTRVGLPYDAGFYIRVLRKHWLEGPNGEVLRAAWPGICERMESAPDMHSFMAAASPFAVLSAAELAAAAEEAPSAGASASAFAAFLAQTNPMGVAHRIAVPTLIFNSDDDPVCSVRNTEENTPELLQRGCARAVLLRYPSGGHCCFAAGWRARRWSDELAARFLAASTRE